jgi:CheY-like chemotaxis protein
MRMAKHVMIVEDHTDIQMLLQAQIEWAGYTTSLAGDGFEALELLETEVPTVILLDLGLPRMDGYAFLEVLEQHQFPLAETIIVLTADQQAVSKLADKPVTIIVKPFSFSRLLAAINSLMKGKTNQTS